ncbi:hypothetical protein D3C72_1896080 [compost metagenome]
MNDDPGYCRNDQRNRNGAGEAMDPAPLEGDPYREQDGRETKNHHRDAGGRHRHAQADEGEQLQDQFDIGALLHYMFRLLGTSMAAHRYAAHK